MNPGGKPENPLKNAAEAPFEREVRQDGQDWADRGAIQRQESMLPRFFHAIRASTSTDTGGRVFPIGIRSGHRSRRP